MWTWATYHQLAKRCLAYQDDSLAPHDLTWSWHLCYLSITIKCLVTDYLTIGRYTIRSLASIVYKVTPFSNYIVLRQLPMASHSSEFQYISLDHLLVDICICMCISLGMGRISWLLATRTYHSPPPSTLVSAVTTINHSRGPQYSSGRPYFPASLSLTTHCVDF
jgi:hypothetical protein